MESNSRTARQQSGKDPSGSHILAVLVKRTYEIGVRGHSIPAQEQLPLVEDPEESEEAASGARYLVRDIDLYPFKPRTDFIVKGHAYGYSGRHQFYAGVQVAGYTLQLLVSGDRRCTLDAYGRALFSGPEPVDKVPLSYTHAYGGLDAAAAEKYGNPAAELLAGIDWLDLSGTSPYLYPRNCCGRGYLVEATPEAVERVALPNLEDPYDLLTPERLVAGSADRWPHQPLPLATDWVDYGWFPRVAYLGLVPDHVPLSGEIAEVRRGHISPDLMTMTQPTNAAIFNLTCGAPRVLQFPHLRGGEQITLESLHPVHPRFSFYLPIERPRIWTDGRKGTLKETEPVIHTVVIEPDENRLTVLWRGAAPALRPYLPEELERMPFRVVWP